MTGIEIYTTRQCPWCVRAKALLDDGGFRYREVDLTGDQAGLLDLAMRTGRRTVPQVFVDGVPIGGFEALRDLRRAGGLV